MRTDRGRRRFYAAGWVISAGVMVVASRMWRLHLREVEQRAEEAERTQGRGSPAQGGGRAAADRPRAARFPDPQHLRHLAFSRAWRCTWPASAARRCRPRCWRSRRRARTPPGSCATTLGVLRSDEDGDSSGLGHLDRLAARARAAGLPVTVTVTGAERALPPEVDQAAYRIVQEALTNVSRHAGPASRLGSPALRRRTPSRSRSTTTARKHRQRPDQRQRQRQRRQRLRHKQRPQREQPPRPDRACANG